MFAIQSRAISVSNEKNPDCLEYIAVYEMMNYIERGYGERFAQLMDSSLPDWRCRRDSLNEAPLGHEEWLQPQ